MQVLFGLWPVIGVIALRAMTPAALVGVRLLCGAPILAIAAGTLRGPLPPARDLAKLAGLAALGISLNQLLFVEGLSRAGPIHASVLGLLIPPFTVGIAALLGRERPGPIRIVGVTVALAGAALLVRPDRLDLSQDTAVGDLLLVCNTAAYSAYLVLVRGTIARLGALRATAWIMLLGAVEALPFVALPMAAVGWSSLSGATWAALAFVVVGPTVLTYLLNAWALGRAPASVVAIYVALQPLVAALASAWWLGIRPAESTAVAALVLVAGLVLATRTPTPGR